MINEPILARSKGRVGQTKSKNGCLTCKIRRVKCSEERPQCHRCTSTGRKCEYKAATGHDFRSWSRNSPTLRSPSSSQSSPLAVALDSHPLAATGSFGGCSLELRAFEYFFMRGPSIFPRATDDRFWKTCILQACHAEPVIWDAVISLSALFEHPQYSKEPVRGLRGAPRNSPGTPAKDPAHQQALVWYSRSLSKLRTSLDKGMVNDTVVLVSCILYICIELLQDNVTEVLQLYHHGTGIMSNRKASLMEECVSPLFYNFSALATCMDYIPTGTAAPQLEGFEISDRFSSLEEAEVTLHRFLSRGVTHVRASEQVLLFEENVPEERIAKLEAEKEFLWNELEKWYQTFCAMGFTLESNNTTPAEKYVTAKLLQAHATFRISIATSLVISEMKNDTLTAEFEDILRYGRFGIEATRYPDGTQPPFSLETSMALPIFVCATKCRDYRIRHQALELLQEAPPVQGLCNAATHAVMAAKVIALEEAALELVDGEMFIPEERRISNFFITSGKSETGENMWVLQYMRNVPVEDGGYQIVTDLSPFDSAGRLPA